MIVLGIESTCDETSCALVKDGHEILSNIISSQIDLHAEFGGVVPELSCRRHIEVIIPVLEECLKKADKELSDIDLISVAYGPGLIGTLLIGLNMAKTLSIALNKPFIGVNHIEAHLYAALMENQKETLFPAIGVVLSGGHTCLVLIEAIGEYKLIGETVDDAIGEAFDKVAKQLNLPYPGGPQIEMMAKEGNPLRFNFKPCHVKDHPLNFSFSGLKTAVLYTLKGQNNLSNTPLPLTRENCCDIAASFQKAALTDVLEKVLAASKKHSCNTIVLGGGVTNNQALRLLFQQKAKHLKTLWPPKGLSLDNAAMIAGLGYHHYIKNKKGDPLDKEAATRIVF